MTSGGQAVLKLRLATSETYLDRNKVRQERTEWHSVVVWGKRAEALGKFLTKGSRLFIEGGLRTSNYDDKDGNKRYRTEIVASNIILSGGGGRGGGGGGGGGGGDYGDDFGGPPGGGGGGSRGVEAAALVAAAVPRPAAVLRRPRLRRWRRRRHPVLSGCAPG